MFMLILIALIPLTAGPLAAQQATPGAAPVAAEEVYTDPSGAFSVPLPLNWDAEPLDNVVRLISPEGDLTVTIAAVPSKDLDSVIRDTWTMTAQGAEPEATSRQEVPSAPGIDRSVVVDYGDPLQTGRVLQAVGEQVGATSYVLLLEGDLAAVTRRQSQLQVILTRFQISEVEEVDLSAMNPATLTPEMLEELGAYIERTRTQFGIPGVSVAVVQDGEIVYREGFGVRELGSNEPVTPETGMLIGSVTKPMTTLMMATMVDDGVLSWETPVVDILPSFAIADPELSERLTVRDLVCACTGVPRRDLELSFNAAELDPADVIASLATFDLFTPVGEAFQYSNQMVATVGYIAAWLLAAIWICSPTRLRGQLQPRVLDPVGMAGTSCGSPRQTWRRITRCRTARWLSGDARPGGGVRVGPVMPAGGAWSTADDLAQSRSPRSRRASVPMATASSRPRAWHETWQPAWRSARTRITGSAGSSTTIRVVRDPSRRQHPRLHVRSRVHAGRRSRRRRPGERAGRQRLHQRGAGAAL